MRRYLTIALSIFGLALFLGFFFWGIIKLQSTGNKSSEHNIQKRITEQNLSSESSMTKRLTKSVEVIFTAGDKIIQLGKQPLIRLTYDKSAEKPLVEIDTKLAEALIAALKNPSPTTPIDPARVIEDKKGKPQRIMRGTAFYIIDRDQTLMTLKGAAYKALETGVLTVPIVFKTDEGPEGFDSQRQKLGFDVCLSRFETLHPDHATDEARNTNLQIASKKCDGLILQPGEEFNFDKVVGPRVAKNGFKMAGVISDGRVVPGMGGGVCQVSTTLYRAALLANMKILERHNHSIYEGIPYADRGLDAAIAWGSKNFRFLNSLDVPILISAQAGNGRVHVALFAPTKPFEKVEVVTRNEAPIQFPIQFKKSKKLKEGEKRIVRPGVTGYTIDAYRIVTTAGMSREEKLSSDKYLMFPQVEEISN